ncbi:hypothetical protein OB920_13305 [Halobacteria archaeon HArc-gm2]|nr:hypothetical protein [Halobacteria archaeon HArc-gm2]
MGGTGNFYADDELLEKLDELPNKSEFIRNAVGAALSAESESERRLSEIDDDIDDIDEKIRGLKQSRSELVKEREEIEAVVGAVDSSDSGEPERVQHVFDVVEEMLSKPTHVWEGHLNKNLNDNLAESITEDVTMHQIDNPDANAVSGEFVKEDLRDEGFDPEEVITADHNEVYALSDEAFEIFDGLTSRERAEIEELLN